MPKIPTYALARSAERETSPQTRLASGVARPGAPHDRHQAERARQDLLLPALLQGATPAQSDGPTPVSPEHGRSSPVLPPLLTTKLHAPRLRTRLVSRAHLIEKLRRGVQGPLTLLSAPAGFGKTTVLAQWLRESDMPVAWLSLEPEDNDPTRFFLSLIAALQTLDPQIGAAARAVLQTPQPPSPEAMLVRLVNELMECGEAIWPSYWMTTMSSLLRLFSAAWPLSWSTCLPSCT